MTGCGKAPVSPTESQTHGNSDTTTGNTTETPKETQPELVKSDAKPENVFSIKDGAVYQKYAGICFETQFYPNSCKEKRFPSCILPVGKKFSSRTVYKFGVEE